MSSFQGRLYLGLRILLTIIVAVQSRSVSSITEAQKYLSIYGGVPTSADTTATKDGLVVRPRCGVHDKVDFITAKRSKRYVVHESRWPRTNLTYKILNYPSSLEISEIEVDAEIARAFSLWSDYSPLTFRRQERGEADINIKFATDEHGDKAPFDGPGGSVGHGFYPMFGGSVHFDDAEMWTIGKYRGIDLFQTAAHEIGHALGLEHSNIESALMAPVYSGYNPNFKLDPDDIAGIQFLYGEKTYASDGTARKWIKSWLDWILQQARKIIGKEEVNI